MHVLKKSASSDFYDVSYTVIHHNKVRCSTVSELQQLVLTHYRLQSACVALTHLDAGDAQGRLQVLRHAEGHTLRHAQTLALLEADVVVNVHHL